MEKKKQTYTPEQKERHRIKKAEWLANRSPEKVAEDKAKARISQANLTLEQKEQRKITLALKKANRSPEQIAEDLAKKKIYEAEWRAKRSPEKVAEDKAKQKIVKAKWNEKNPNYIPPCIIANPSYKKEQHARFYKAHPNYIQPSAEDLGYYVVYIIPNYIGTEASYCGQTGNLYNRMSLHRSVGRLNTESHRILGCFRTREQAMAFEAIQHEAGYHGGNNGK